MGRREVLHEETRPDEGIGYSRFPDYSLDPVMRWERVMLRPEEGQEHDLYDPGLTAGLDKGLKDAFDIRQVRRPDEEHFPHAFKRRPVSSGTFKIKVDISVPWISRQASFHIPHPSCGIDILPFQII